MSTLNDIFLRSDSLLITKNKKRTDLTNEYNFHPLEAGDRVSDPQLKVGEKFNSIIWRLKG